MTHNTSVGQHIELLSDKGCNLKICNIISKHLRLQSIDDIRTNQEVCTACFRALSDFHQFYHNLIVTNNRLCIQATSATAKDAPNASPQQSEASFDADEHFTEVPEDTDTSPAIAAFQSDDEAEIDIPSAVELKDANIDSDVDDNEDNEFVTTIDISLDAEDSVASSNESTDENEEHSDNEPSEPKLLVPLNRQGAEEIDRRYTQKEEYENVIQKFFGSFSCPKCDATIKKINQLNDHFRAFHDNERPFVICCNRKYRHRKELADHVFLHLDPDYFKCTECGKVLRDRRSFEAHVKTHKNPSAQKKGKTFTCEICQKVFITKPAYNDHRISKHMPQSEFNVPCPHCDKKLPTKRMLNGHIRYTHNPGSAICDKCGKQVRNEACLRKHHRLQHPVKPLPPPVPVKCKICDHWYRHEYGLKQHIRLKHEDTGGEHRCHICNKVSVTAHALKHHIYVNHQSNRKFQCTICEKTFKVLQELKEHTATHTDVALYSCPDCPRTFNANCNLHRHRKIKHRAQWEANRKRPKPSKV